MNLLYRHLRKHAGLVFQALFCAGAIQLLLLLDPLHEELEIIARNLKMGLLETGDAKRAYFTKLIWDRLVGVK